MAEHNSEEQFYRTTSPALRPETCDHKDDRYHNRFGDVLCWGCHSRVGWRPELVRDDVFGEGTEDFRRNHKQEITARGDHHLLRVGLIYLINRKQRHTV